MEGSLAQKPGSLEDRSSDGSLDIASIPPPPVLAQEDSLEGVGEAIVEEEEELARPRPQPPPPPRTLSRISEGSFSRQMGSSGEDSVLAATGFLLQPCPYGPSSALLRFYSGPLLVYRLGGLRDASAAEAPRRRVVAPVKLLVNEKVLGMRRARGGNGRRQEKEKCNFVDLSVSGADDETVTDANVSYDSEENVRNDSNGRRVNPQVERQGSSVDGAPLPPPPPQQHATAVPSFEEFPSPPRFLIIHFC